MSSKLAKNNVMRRSKGAKSVGMTESDVTHNIAAVEQLRAACYADLPIFSDDRDSSSINMMAEAHFDWSESMSDSQHGMKSGSDSFLNMGLSADSELHLDFAKELKKDFSQQKEHKKDHESSRCHRRRRGRSSHRHKHKSSERKSQSSCVSNSTPTLSKKQVMFWAYKLGMTPAELYILSNEELERAIESKYRVKYIGKDKALYYKKLHEARRELRKHQSKFLDKCGDTNPVWNILLGAAKDIERVYGKIPTELLLQAYEQSGSAMSCTSDSTNSTTRMTTDTSSMSLPSRPCYQEPHKSTKHVDERVPEGMDAGMAADMAADVELCRKRIIMSHLLDTIGTAFTEQQPYDEAVRMKGGYNTTPLKQKADPCTNHMYSDEPRQAGGLNDLYSSGSYNAKYQADDCDCDDVMQTTTYKKPLPGQGGNMSQAPQQHSYMPQPVQQADVCFMTSTAAQPQQQLNEHSCQPQTESSSNIQRPLSVRNFTDYIMEYNQEYIKEDAQSIVITQLDEETGFVQACSRSYNTPRDAALKVANAQQLQDAPAAPSCSPTADYCELPVRQQPQAQPQTTPARYPTQPVDHQQLYAQQRLQQQMQQQQMQQQQRARFDMKPNQMPPGGQRPQARPPMRGGHADGGMPCGLAAAPPRQHSPAPAGQCPAKKPAASDRRDIEMEIDTYREVARQQLKQLQQLQQKLQQQQIVLQQQQMRLQQQQQQNQNQNQMPQSPGAEAGGICPAAHGRPCVSFQLARGQNMPGGMTGGMPAGMTGGMPAGGMGCGASGGMGGGSPGGMRGGMPGGMGGGMPGAMGGGMPGAMGGGMHGGMGGGMPGGMAGGMHGGIGGGMPGGMGGGMPGGMGGGMSGGMGGGMPGGMGNRYMMPPGQSNRQYGPSQGSQQSQRAALSKMGSPAQMQPTLSTYESNYPPQPMLGLTQPVERQQMQQQLHQQLQQQMLSYSKFVPSMQSSTLGGSHNTAGDRPQKKKLEMEYCECDDEDDDSIKGPTSAASAEKKPAEPAAEASAPAEETKADEAEGDAEPEEPPADDEAAEEE